MLRLVTMPHGPGKLSLDHWHWRRLDSSEALDGR